MPNVSFHPGYSGALLLAVAGSAMILVAVSYARAYRALRPWQWAGLYVLRMSAVAVVLLLLFRPVLSFQRESRERRAAVLLLDRSASMAIADDAAGATRFEHAVERLPVWAQKLSGDLETHLLAFSDAVDPVANLEELPKLRPDGQATSLSRALGAAVKVKAARDVVAVFLISDGVHNSAGDPLAAARGLGAPIYTVGTGAASRGRATRRDVRVTDVDVPPEMAVQNLARVKAYIDASGFPGRVTQVVLAEDDKRVATGEIVLDDADGAQEVVLEFVPAAKGVHTYRVHVPAAAEEKIPENNERAVSSLVVDARIRTLYIEGTLRAEYGALVGRFLAKDPNIEFCALVQTRPNVFMRRSNIAGLELTAVPQDRETLDKFDVFILGDLDSSYLRREQMEAIGDRVRKGAGLIMLGGYHSLGPGGYQETPLAELLPVFLGNRDAGQVAEPFVMQLTPAGRQHAIFANIAQFFPSGVGPAEVAGLPPLQGSARVAGAKPGASVLAVHPGERAGAAPLPIMAVQPCGQGRAAVFTADTTRNWQQSLRTLDRETPFLRFWGQTVRWLAGRNDPVDTEAGVVATTDKAYYEPETPIHLAAVVRGKGGEAAAEATVTARVTGPSRTVEELRMTATAGPAGRYQADYEPRQSGRYDIRVTAALPGAALQSGPLRVDVGRPNLEYDRLELDEQTLVAIAEASGGRYAHIATADRLIDRLCHREGKRQIRYEAPLAWPPLLWAVFVVVLTTEWLLRRRCMLR